MRVNHLIITFWGILIVYFSLIVAAVAFPQAFRRERSFVLQRAPQVRIKFTLQQKMKPLNIHVIIGLDTFNRPTSFTVQLTKTRAFHA